jgi:hypothetical protein
MGPLSKIFLWQALLRYSIVSFSLPLSAIHTLFHFFIIVKVASDVRVDGQVELRRLVGVVASYLRVRFCCSYGKV